MKSRDTKQKDLGALTEQLQNAKSTMIVSFTGLTVNKDIEFRNSIRSAGAKYQVVKNTLARIAVKDTPFEQASESLKGVTAIAWTDSDPVVLSKTVSKFMKDNAAIYQFKSGVVDGKLVDFKQLETIASLPSKEELISKLMWVLNSGAQRLVTVINAVPRDLAIVIKQIGDKVSDSSGSGEAPEAEAAAPEAAEETARAVEPAAPAAIEETSATATESAAPAAEAQIETPDASALEGAAEVAPSADEAPSSGEEARSKEKAE
ncbi:MAG: 50S ribosomal protein L10 [Acidobacteria bacterium]|nr:50S ribosomal protein L10 [Acidobacteriota bacterium]